MQYKELAHILETQVLPAYVKAVEDSVNYSIHGNYYKYLVEHHLQSGICLKLMIIDKEASTVFSNYIKDVFLYVTPSEFKGIAENIEALQYRIKYMRRFINKHGNNTNTVRNYSLSRLPF